MRRRTPEPSIDAMRAARRRARRDWPMHRFDLGREPSEDLTASTTAAERFAMVWPLTLLAWRLAGRKLPRYERCNMPGTIFRSPGGE